MTPKVRRRDCDPAAQPETAVAPAFPSARYFQIHFEQLYRLIDELSEKIEVATRELALLRARAEADVARDPAPSADVRLPNISDASPRRRSRIETKTETDNRQSKRHLANRANR
jgi:hypothetical protein